MTQIETDLHHLAELIKDIRVAMMTTFPSKPTEHFCHTRPMYTQRVDPATFKGELIFLTDNHTGKVREIEDEDRVLLTYAEPSHNRFVSVLGRATVARDPKKVRELWNLMLKAWWPAGPDDPSIAVIRVKVDAAEYWDGPSNTLFTLQVIKSLVTGNAMSEAMREPEASQQNHKTIIL